MRQRPDQRVVSELRTTDIMSARPVLDGVSATEPQSESRIRWKRPGDAIKEMVNNMDKYILVEVPMCEDEFGKLYVAKSSNKLEEVKARREEIIKAREHGPFGSVPRAKTEQVFRILKVVE